MRLALFTPLSPLHTAIADHVEGLLPYLADFAQIDLYIEDGYVPSNPAVIKGFAVHSYRQFAKVARQYDLAVYHMGNEPTFHGYIYKVLQEHHGLVVLHDLVLHHCIAGLTLSKGNTRAYLEEMRYAYGREGEEAARKILSGRRQDLMHKYPLVERVAHNSQGMIVHNNYARQQVLKRSPGLPIATIGQHFFLPQGVSPDQDRAQLREKWGLTGRFVVGTYGLLIDAKQLDVALGAFARFRRDEPRALYLLVGPVARDFDLTGMVRRLGLEDSVRLVGWQDPPSFVRHMLVADLAVQLRYPHIGGTPYTPIRLMGLGIPTIVTNIEPLAEIPEGCCVKVDVDEHEGEVLLATMQLLATDGEARQELAERGRSYIQTEHHPRTVAQKYKAFIETLLSPTVQTAESAPSDWEHYLIQEVAAILADWGVQSGDTTLLLPFAETIANLKLRESSSGGGGSG
jgi:glycosyltransferase involved in cell wall biosynthesis